MEVDNNHGKLDTKSHPSKISYTLNEISIWNFIVKLIYLKINRHRNQKFENQNGEPYNPIKNLIFSTMIALISSTAIAIPDFLGPYAKTYKGLLIFLWY